MTIGSRIKKLRRELDLTQQKFGERLCVKGNTIAQYELGRSNPVDSVFSLMVREFNVNEHWLRTGEGEMFKPEESDELDKLAKKYNLSNASCIAVKKFINLKPETQKEFIDFFIDVSKAIIESEQFDDNIIHAINGDIPKTPAELKNKYTVEKFDDDKPC